MVYFFLFAVLLFPKIVSLERVSLAVVPVTRRDAQTLVTFCDKFCDLPHTRTRLDPVLGSPSMAADEWQ